MFADATFSITRSSESDKIRKLSDDIEHFVDAERAAMGIFRREFHCGGESRARARANARRSQ